MGTIHHLTITNLTEAVRAYPIPTLRCENCGADKAPSDIALLFVHGPVPDPLDPRLLFICDDCNITLTTQGFRLVTLAQSADTYHQLTETMKHTRIESDYPHQGTDGG